MEICILQLYTIEHVSARVDRACLQHRCLVSFRVLECGAETLGVAPKAPPLTFVFQLKSVGERDGCNLSADS